MWIKKLLLSLSFLLLLSPLLFSQVYEITETERTELLTIFNELEASLMRDEQRIKLLQTELTEASKSQRISNQAARSSRIVSMLWSERVNELQAELRGARDSSAISEQKYREIESALKEAETSFSDYRKEQRRERVKNSLLAFLVGLLVGGAVGVIAE